MPHYVYILYSEKLDRYYTGNSDLNPDQRLAQHNNIHYENAYTSRGIPWLLFFHFECESRLKARRIEAHIKKMKSKVYIQNLKRYPDLIQKLLKKF